MITSVWESGKQRLLKATVKSKRQGQRSGINHNVKVKKVLLEKRASADRVFTTKVKATVKINAQSWQSWIKLIHPEHFKPT